MLSRLFVILLFVPLLMWIFIKGEISLLVFTTIIIGFSLFEFYRMLKNKGYEVASNIGMALGLFLPVAIYFQKHSTSVFTYFKWNFIKQINFDMGGFIVFSIMILSFRQILKGKIKGAMAEISYTLFGIIYVAYLFSYILLIRYEFPKGNVLVTMTFLLIWACDIMAYVVGMSIGGKIFGIKLSPKISPNKSIEGAIGGILGSFGLILVFDEIYVFISSLICKLPYLKSCTVSYSDVSIGGMKALILAIAVAIFAEIGDLVESKIKREFNVKDSGSLLLGHGGFLDRFDSALFVLPIVYFFMKYVA